MSVALIASVRFVKGGEKITVPAPSTEPGFLGVTLVTANTAPSQLASRLT
ncbi:hypothetical protein AB3X91_16130 [Paraburkholderia sp. BR14263]